MNKQLRKRPFNDRDAGCTGNRRRLSVGRLAGYSKAMGKYKTNHLIEQLTMLITNIRNSFIGQHDFSDINNNLLINIGAVPADMYDHSRASNDILHAWNGKVTIFPSEASNNKQMAFELYVNNISKNVCIEMVTMDWGKDPSSALQASTSARWKKTLPNRR